MFCITNFSRSVFLLQLKIGVTSNNLHFVSKVFFCNRSPKTYPTRQHCRFMVIFAKKLETKFGRRLIKYSYIFSDIRSKVVKETGKKKEMF